MADCFISYRRTPSAPVATTIQTKLQSTHRIDAYVDTTRTDGTKVRFPERLMEAIAEAPVFVCLLGERDGQHTLESEWVLKEIEQAYNLRKFCIPVFQESYRPLATVPPAVDYLLGFDGVHYFDVKNIMVDDSVRQIADLIRPQRKRPLPIVWIAAALLVVLLVGALLVNGVIGGNGSTTPTLDATPATQAALQPIDSPTDNPTLTLTPTESSTPDIEEAARQLLAQQTAQAIVDQATATAARATQDYALNQTQIANLTATATLWTVTPTPNMTASVEAVLTRWAQATQTQASMDATATATLWTPTPTPTITPTPTLAPVTRNADWTPQSTTIGAFKMMRVPPGCFDMGENGEGGRQCFDAPFWIGETEVTNAQYAEFVSAGGYNEQRYWTEAGWAWKTENNRTAPRDYDNFTDDNQPRVGVSWYEAVAYTQWLTEQLRASGSIGQEEEIRLPTESEWEYAARGPDGLTYPWGNTFDGTRLNFCDTNCGYDWRDATVDDGYGSVTAPVGSYPLGASWVGALDMSGNVWEWSLSGYAEYPYVGTDGRNGISENITYRVLRGGSFDNLRYYAAASCRNLINPDLVDLSYGVRLVLSAPYASLSSEAP